MDAVIARTSWSRRDVLRAGLAATAGLAPAPLLQAAPTPTADHVIFLHLVGGPSQLDTWDPKPNAPADIRGPFRPMATSVPGIRVSELFPRLAQVMHHVALVRSMYHDAAPIHETGQQLVQTGFTAAPDFEPPHLGAIAQALAGRAGRAPAAHLLPGPITNTGVSVSHGQESGWLGRRGQVGTSLSNDAPEAYGNSRFGRDCWHALQLVRRGAKLVTVNMFTTVFDVKTWDCHADGASLGTTLGDYRDHVAPMFDRAYAALITDLAQRGMLNRTLVVATGEFGRTPKLNRRGGRDHWPSVWTALFAGGGVPGGQVIGRSDGHGAYPKDQPVSAGSVATTVLSALGLWDRYVAWTHAAGQPTPSAVRSPFAVA